MYDWFELRSASVHKNNYKRTGNKYSEFNISLNGSKPICFMTDGTVKINFTQDDVGEAAMFLLQFETHIIRSDFNEDVNLNQGLSRTRIS